MKFKPIAEKLDQAALSLSEAATELQGLWNIGTHRLTQKERESLDEKLNEVNHYLVGCENQITKFRGVELKVEEKINQ